jgi:hypothetical protein
MTTPYEIYDSVMQVSRRLDEAKARKPREPKPKPEQISAAGMRALNLVRRGSRDAAAVQIPPGQRGEEAGT